MFAMRAIVPRIVATDPHWGPKIEATCGSRPVKASSRCRPQTERCPTPRMRRPHTAGHISNSQHRDSNGNCKEIDDQGTGQEGRSREEGRQGLQRRPSPLPLKPIKESDGQDGADRPSGAALPGIEAKAVKAVLSSLEATVLASVHKKGLGFSRCPAC